MCTLVEVTRFEHLEMFILLHLYIKSFKYVEMKISSLESNLYNTFKVVEHGLF